MTPGPRLPPEAGHFFEALSTPSDSQSIVALGWREVLLVVVSFLAATLVLTLPVAAHPTRTLPSDLTDTLLNTWIIGWDADRLGHGLRGLWDAPIFFPYRDTLAFSENLFGLGFIVAPVYWLSGNPVLTYNSGFVPGGPWLQPNSVLTGRLARISAQFDF